MHWPILFGISRRSRLAVVVGQALRLPPHLPKPPRRLPRNSPNQQRSFQAHLDFFAFFLSAFLYPSAPCIGAVDFATKKNCAQSA